MIVLKDVKKSFGDKHILRGLTARIEKGKINFIIGKSGEGKSVTIKHIIGLMKPDTGSIQVNGQEMTQFSESELRKYRQKFGMLFQHAALFDSLSVGDNISFPLREGRRSPENEIKDRVAELLEQVDLKGYETKMPSELSTGEKKRVGLARALVTSPDYILYDEPTTGMDPLVCEMIDELITRVGESNKNLTSIVISHDLKATLQIADHVIMIYQGKAIHEGSPDSFRTTNDSIVRQFFSGKTDGPMEFL